MTTKPELTPEQRRDIERARSLLAAGAHGPATLAVFTRSADPGDPYPEAFGLAYVSLESLLAIIDALTGGGS